MNGVRVTRLGEGSLPFAVEVVKEAHEKRYAMPEAVVP